MTNTSIPKVITVYGATGAQGGAVVRSLVQNKTFRVRAITRNPSSKTAQELEALGAELVQADGWKKDTIKTAVANSWAVFVNTNSDDPVGRPFQEIQGQVDWSSHLDLSSALQRKADLLNLTLAKASSTVLSKQAR